MRDDRGYYKPGDFYIVDDRTGWKTRQSDIRKQWNGLLVDKDVYEERNVQEFVRGFRDDYAVKNARPVPPATYIGPRSTTIGADAAAGTTTITVESSADFTAGDRIAIMLDNLDRHLATVSSIPDGTSIAFTPALPWAASALKQVVNQTNVVAATI